MAFIDLLSLTDGRIVTNLLARILFAQFLPRGRASANSMKLASCIERSEGGVVPPRVTRRVVPVTVQATTVRTVVRVTTSLKEAMFTEADRKYFISTN